MKLWRGRILGVLLVVMFITLSGSLAEAVTVTQGESHENLVYLYTNEKRPDTNWLSYTKETFSVPLNTRIQIKANEHADYQFAYWEVNYGDIEIEWPNSPETYVTLQRESSIKAVFAKKHNCDENWKYSEKKDETHRKTCKVCKQTWTEDHTWGGNMGFCVACEKVPNKKFSLKVYDLDNKLVKDEMIKAGKITTLYPQSTGIVIYWKFYKVEDSEEYEISNIERVTGTLTHKASNNSSRVTTRTESYLTYEMPGYDVVVRQYREQATPSVDTSSTSSSTPNKSDCKGVKGKTNYNGYQTSTTEHWVYCTCGERHKYQRAMGTDKGAEKHFDNNNDGKCDICSYAVKLNSATSSSPSNTECKHTELTAKAVGNNCYWECTCGEQFKYKNKSAVGQNSNHGIDTNSNGKCDNCGLAFSSNVQGVLIKDTAQKRCYYTWDNGKTKYKDANKTKKGMNTHAIGKVCTVCGEHACKGGTKNGPYKGFYADAEGHWVHCSVTGCEQILKNTNSMYVGKNKHQVSKKTGLCMLCGYGTGTSSTQTTPSAEEVKVCSHRSYSGYEFDVNSHYKVCSTCGEKFSSGRHTYKNNSELCSVCRWNKNWTHKCTGSTYEVNEEGHYIACTYEGCENIFPNLSSIQKMTSIGKVEKHKFTYGKCFTCNYEKHVHIGGSEYFSDNTKHWTVCDCGADIKFRAKGSKSQGTTAHKFGPDKATCTECGFVKASTKQCEHKNKIYQEYTDLYSPGAGYKVGHELVCKDCGLKMGNSTRKPHTFNASGSECTVCGYHRCMEFEYLGKLNTHVYVCVNPDCRNIQNEESHYDDDSDGICDYCGHTDDHYFSSGFDKDGFCLECQE